MRLRLWVTLSLLAVMAMSCELFFGFDELEVATAAAGGLPVKAVQVARAEAARPAAIAAAARAANTAT